MEPSLRCSGAERPAVFDIREGSKPTPECIDLFIKAQWSNNTSDGDEDRNDRDRPRNERDPGSGAVALNGVGLEDRGPPCSLENTAGNVPMSLTAKQDFHFGR